MAKPKQNVKAAPKQAKVKFTPEQAKAYWKANLRLIGILLSIWFFVSYVLGIILAEPLSTVKIGQLPLSFWFAQQGSIYTFVILILVYAVLMDRMDKRFGVDE
ncbi:MAG: DUF4212 domain-containing protein [Caldilineaceae bacterium]|nr:DUF4212 domain-containing protein [Caldilineaceae bacterium]MBP8107293.1 DUF4212 domain-containing protein [Caldilineaceae bacterium]MBP8123510.1 DUF4212 domain-containing protein [Caldilineaceae bacterium]MBP9073730.1 DUF4212 domain-containing protein [Caldilineaceae bacterium]